MILWTLAICAMIGALLYRSYRLRNKPTCVLCGAPTLPARGFGWYRHRPCTNAACAGARPFGEDELDEDARGRAVSCSICGNVHRFVRPCVPIEFVWLEIGGQGSSWADYPVCLDCTIEMLIRSGYKRAKGAHRLTFVRPNSPDVTLQFMDL